MGRRAAAWAALLLLTLGQWRLMDRVLWDGHGGGGDEAFVLAGVDGVLAGRPVSPSWAQRLAGPAAVAGLAHLTGGDRRRALIGFTDAMVLAANLLLFALVRRRGHDEVAALTRVALFALLRALLLYRLEYPWDELDVLLFLTFGDYARRDGPAWRLWPLLLVGLFNHETILYVPLWYLLAPGRRRDFAAAGVATALLAGAIWLVRAHCYLGRPDLPAALFEPSLPGVANHLHVAHNLDQWLVHDWREGRVFIAATFTAAVLLLAARLRRHTRSSLWTLAVLASIVAFGYVNETRHYLLLLAFWVAYL
jgi:hypothetical protein